MKTIPEPLINAEKLREVVFDQECRPSMRSIREWTRLRILPHVRIGRLCFYDPAEVRAALNQHKARP